MPIYSFRCGQCGEVIEALVKGDAVQFCPSCKVLMDRAVSPANFSLSGGGWAKDGYSK